MFIISYNMWYKSGSTNDAAPDSPAVKLLHAWYQKIIFIMALQGASLAAARCQKIILHNIKKYNIYNIL